YHGGEPSPDALAVAGVAAERDFQIALARQAIFVEQQRSAAGLAHDQVEHTEVAEVRSDHGPAVAVVVGPRQVADLEGSPARHIQKGALAFEGAEIVAVGDDLPGVVHPELAERFVQRTGQLHIATAIAWL